jgi:hypothetical protein
VKATRESDTAIGPRARSMNGRRRPSDICVASLMGPTRSGRKNAKTPSAAKTSPTSVLESVNFSSSGGK